MFLFIISNKNNPNQSSLVLDRLKRNTRARENQRDHYPTKDKILAEILTEEEEKILLLLKARTNDWQPWIWKINAYALLRNKHPQEGT